MNSFTAIPRQVDLSNGRISSVRSSDSWGLSIDGTTIPLPPGATILPGFIDTHCHLVGPGQMSERIDLRPATSLNELLRLVKGRREELVREKREGEWILGFGWNEQNWSDTIDPADFRTHLDRIVPDLPVALYRIDFHAVWLNTSGLRASRLFLSGEGDEWEVRNPAFAHQILRAGDGSPTGIILEDSVKELEHAFPPPGIDRMMEWYRFGIRECLKYGITGLHDMNVHPDWIEPMVRLADRGEFSLKSWLFLDGTEDRWRSVSGPGRIARNVVAAGVKYFSDGALGSRGALMLEPYADAPETTGIRMLTSDELVAMASGPLDGGYAIATHAIGDGANRLVIDAYEELRRRTPDGTLRIEHTQIVHPDDLDRIAAAEIVAAMQAIHCPSDAAMAEERLGPDRTGWSYPWKSLRDRGVTVIGGSDFPVESPDPLAGIRAFVKRETERGVWHPEQRISLEDAIAAYTMLAPCGLPKALRSSAPQGTLEPGGAGDIVVIEGDVVNDSCRVSLTVVDGVVRYRDGEVIV